MDANTFQNVDLLILTAVSPELFTKNFKYPRTSNEHRKFASEHVL